MKKFLYIQLGIVVLLLTILAIWPVTVPVRVIEPQEGEIDPVVLETNEQLEQVIQVPMSGLSEIITQEQKALNPGEIIMQVQDEQGNVIREVSGKRDIGKKAEVKWVFEFAKIKAKTTSIARLRFVNYGNEVKWKPGNQDMAEDNEDVNIAIVFQTRMGALAAVLNSFWSHDTAGDDIGYYWQRGGQIKSGENPYKCALDNTCIGYPAHFPLVYWMSAGMQQLGLTEYEDWIEVWRVIVTIVWFGGAGLLGAWLWRRKQPVLGVLAALFWLFNRWSLYVARIAHTDFLGVVSLIGAVTLVEQHALWAALILGVSLSVKQVAVVFVPVFLISVWQRTRPGKKVKITLLAAVLVSAIPVVSILPFVWDNPAAVVKGLTYSVTREARMDYDLPALPVVLDFGSVGKMVVVGGMMALVYAALWWRKINIYEAGLAIFTILIGFFPTLLHQYFVWLMPWAWLAIGLRRRKNV